MNSYEEIRRRVHRESDYNWWLRRTLARIRGAFGRPVCPRCWRPFSDWFVWHGWSYCYPCHDEDRIVILEPAAKRAPFYD